MCTEIWSPELVFHISIKEHLFPRFKTAAHCTVVESEPRIVPPNIDLCLDLKTAGCLVDVSERVETELHIDALWCGLVWQHAVVQSSGRHIRPCVQLISVLLEQLFQQVARRARTFTAAGKASAAVGYQKEHDEVGHISMRPEDPVRMSAALYQACTNETQGVALSLWVLLGCGSAVGHLARPSCLLGRVRTVVTAPKVWKGDSR